MKKLIIIAVLFALCGFGAFKHFAAQNATRTKNEQRTAAADTEFANLTQKNRDTEAKLATDKLAIEEELKKVAAEELAKAKEPHLKTLAELKAKLAELAPAAEVPAEGDVPPVSEARQLAETELAAVTAEFEAVKARLAKLETEATTLKKYKDAEIAAMPASRRAKVK